MFGAKGGSPVYVSGTKMPFPCSPAGKILRCTDGALVRRVGSILMIAAGQALADGAGQGVSAWPAIDAEFANPPAEFRLVQYSKHDGALLPYAKMAESGIGGVKLFMQSDGYLRSEEAWENMGKNIAAADEAGFDVWIADDNGYPSGMAGGLVVEAYQNFETRCLVEVSKTGEGTSAVKLDLPSGAEKFVHAFLYPLVDGKPDFDRAQQVAVLADRVETKGLEGLWQLSAFAVQISREGTQAESTKEGFKTTGRYPNLLNAAAMEKFLTLTHGEYARRFGPLAGKVSTFYSNEPNLMSLWFKFDGALQREGGTVFVPWDMELPARFRQDHGYDLLPRLPALYGGDAADCKLTRRHFYQTVATILAENFSGRIADWAHDNGVRAGGHPLLEESMLHHVASYGDFFRFVGPFQVPACDLPMPDGNSYVLDARHFGAPHNYWMPKFLSSIAQARGRDTVAGLLDPMIARPVPDLSPSAGNIRRIVNLAALCGVNQFTTYFDWDKYDPKVYRAVNEYVGRLSLVLRGARSAARVGVYYPIETFQAGFVPSPSTWHPEFWPTEWRSLVERIKDQDEVARSLILTGIDFNWLHGDWIREGSVEDGALLAGGGRYNIMVMPEVGLLPLAVAKKLKEFEKAGGKLIWVKSLPELGDAPDEHEEVQSLFAASKTVRPGRVAREIGPVLPPGFGLRTDGAPLIARFVRDGRRIDYLVNYRAQPMSVPLSSANGGKLDLQVYDPLDGSIAAQQTPVSVTIGPYSSLLIVGKSD